MREKSLANHQSIFSLPKILIVIVGFFAAISIQQQCECELKTNIVKNRCIGVKCLGMDDCQSGICF